MPPLPLYGKGKNDENGINHTTVQLLTVKDFLGLVNGRPLNLSIKQPDPSLHCKEKQPNRND